MATKLKLQKCDQSTGVGHRWDVEEIVKPHVQQTIRQYEDMHEDLGMVKTQEDLVAQAMMAGFYLALDELQMLVAAFENPPGMGTYPKKYLI